MTSSLDSSSLYTCIMLFGQPGPSLLMQPYRPPFPFNLLPSSTHFIYSSSVPPPPPHVSGCFSIPPGSSSPLDSFTVFQWNAGGLNYYTLFRLIPFTLFVSRNLTLIQLPLRIPGFSALRSDHTHSRSGIPSHDTTHASSSVIIFIR